MSARSLYDKIWDVHAVAEDEGDTLLYIDFHLVYEVTSPQAFAGLAAAGRTVRRPERTLAVVDHNAPTENQAAGAAGVRDPAARRQMEALAANAARHGIEFYPLGDPRNGIVHVVGPERGRTLPGMTIVCGDSHTSTHGAFGALAFGIGTSEVEHVLATQTLRARKQKNMLVRFNGGLPAGCSAKDMALTLIAQIGAAGGAGCVMEYAGDAVRALSMEARMTLCNMSIEAGARAGLVAPDETTFAYVRETPLLRESPRLAAMECAWRALASDAGVCWDKIVEIDCGAIAPRVTWGTSPDQSAPIDGAAPDPAHITDPAARAGVERALKYMDLSAGQALIGLPVQRVFIGSCTNARIEDLRTAASIVSGRRVAGGVRAMVAPGSGRVRRQAEAEGLDRVFIAAGFEWREPGCSMCLGMNEDRAAPGERVASTSNRNFEGRQGRGARTHLMSPAMAAAAAIAGALVDVRVWSNAAAKAAS
ncbi:MAG: 3-isopropylmalate dehydratase large subunit [Hyphomonadaceae bacterium]